MPVATKGGDFTPVSAGVHHAVCYQVIEVGTQPAFGNFPPRRKVMVVWELPHERIMVKAKEGNGAIELPRAISKEYTLSTDTKANLRKDLEAWRGRAFTAEEADRFEVGNLIGANCQLNVAHKPSRDGSKTYANVMSIMPLGKGAVKLKPENPTMIYDFPKAGEPFNFPPEMPEWMQNKIKNSEEYQESLHGEPAQEQPKASDSKHADEDVPF